MDIKKGSYFILMVLLYSPQLIAQVDTFPVYPFINYSANRIENTPSLQAVFQKLKAVEKGQRRQLRIAHLGDSHIQADFFSGQLRANFQRQFGAAGRGLIFFYHQAGTHAPLDYKTESDQTFTSRRRIFQRGAPPIGISGMSVANNATTFSIRLQQKERYGLPASFDQVTLFHNASDYQYYLEPSPNELIRQVPPISQDWLLYSVKKGDTLFGLAQAFGKTVAELKSWNQLKENLLFTGQQLLIKQNLPQVGDLLKIDFQKDTKWTSKAVLPNAINGFTLYGQQEKVGSNAQLFGALLEDTQQSGVLYNMLGVNGATFYHFNHAEHFFEQLAVLAPDLILVTLGTNEAIQSKFYPNQVRKEIQDLLNNVKKYAPEAAVLLTINPEVLIRKTKPSPYTTEVRQMILEEANKAGAAWWDLYEIMGGSESVRDWRKADLAYVDFIHFTKKGYILQAELLYQAFLEAYYAGN